MGQPQPSMATDQQYDTRGSGHAPGQHALQSIWKFVLQMRAPTCAASQGASRVKYALLPPVTHW